MTLRKITSIGLLGLITGLFAVKTPAAVIVTLDASGLTSSTYSANAFTTGIGSDTGTFTVSKSGTVNTSVAIKLSVGGTAVAGTDYVAFPTNITLAANVLSSNLTVALKTGVTLTNGKTIILTLLTNAAYYPGLNTNAVITLIPASDVTNSVASPVGRYWRGSGTDPTYWSQVIPLNNQTGTVYSNVNGNASSLYGIASWLGAPLYHYDATNALSQTNTANRISFNNPIVAFGERVGGTPLYLNQPYSFGVCVGAPVYPGPDMVIAVFSRTNFSLAGFIVLYPPSTGTRPWTNYVANGFQVTKSTNYLSDGATITTNTFGLATTITTSPYMSYGSSFGIGYVLTHTASDQATNYYYMMECTGYANSNSPMVMDSTKTISYSQLYTLEFAARPPWRSVFLDQPHFDGSPLPPFYAGKTVDEIMTNTPAVTNLVTISPATATNLDDSPELRRHPILDNFVASLNNDPMALANYVLNQIDLTDPMDFSDNGNLAEQAINPTGVSRGALGTFLEKQGSPVEQCALLVYLLRQAGVPAVYEFPPRNGMKVLDARLSRMLKFQVHGGFTQAGQLYTTNTMITVNYPWVAAYIGTNWVHIFPWMKDYKLVEGLDLWDQMPTNYANAYLWLRDYLNNTTNISSLAVDNDNTPRVVFPKFVQQQLLANHPGISLDDIGMQVFNRQHNYSRWQDFPTPTWVTNTSTALLNLTDTNIAGISPSLTNIFDTVSLEIYSQADPSKSIQTGDLRLADLHDREFYIYQYVTNSTQVSLNLILLPFRSSITNQYSFTNDTNLLSRQVLSVILTSSDDQLGVRFHYRRHRALSTAYALDPFTAFLGLEAENAVDFERPMRKGEQAAICLDYGRVTLDMLNVHAADIWQMQNALRVNPALTNSISPDVYIGAMMYLAGMSYFEKSDEFSWQNQNLHKVVNLSSWSAGLSKLLPARNSSGGLLNGNIDPILPVVDMANYQIAYTRNGTAKPNSGQETSWANQNYNIIAVANDSAEEHQVLNRFYKQTNSVSTVRLLQIGQSKGLGIVQLNVSNYVAQGNTSYQGHALRTYDTDIWQQTTNLFSGPNGPYNFAYMTPGPITNNAYKGMGSLIIGYNQQAALISPSSLNGGFGDYFSYFTVSPANLNNYNLNYFNDNFSISLYQPTVGASLMPSGFSSYDFLNTYSLILGGTYTLTSFNTLWETSGNTQYGLSTVGSASQNTAGFYQFSQQYGDLGRTTDGGSSWQTQVADPVHPLTGEFFIHETDLQLPGPLPLALGRNYSSQNLADNQFGVGWKLNIMPYLVVSTNGSNIFAADMDGSVMAYVVTATNASVWLPTLAANPQLNNNATAGAGGLMNRLRNRLVQSVNGSTTNYTLYGSDGSIRLFQMATFNNGVLSQTRPYLQRWTDSRGNFYTFTFGMDSTDPSFGEVTKIQCSNGNFLGFNYDIYGHIIAAYTGDGRWLYYEYDNYGDLVNVTLPDNTVRSYQYQHAAQAFTNGSAFYSTHLLTEEDKPEGRTLINAYDSQRRVTNQLSTAGADLNPIRTATFIYSNDFNITNSFTNAISGYTFVIDGNGQTNRYDYTNNLITKITDPLGQTVQQTWYADNATVPGSPRSVASFTDKRGMVTQYQYDANGNMTNSISTGDFTGDGITTQTMTNSAIYNANSLPVQVTDPAGNSTVIFYDPVFNFLPQQVIRYAGGVPVSTNFMSYDNATNVVVNGNTTQTNTAFGLVTRQVRAYGSLDSATNDFTYDGHGFMTQAVRYTGTGDPDVVKTFFYDERGNQVVSMDAAGAFAFMEYDALNRLIEQDNCDEYGTPLSWNFTYYNDNGEVSWVDGPRFNPEDYIFYDYDGAGRVSTEIHWRAEGGKRGGPYVEAPSGYNLYAQTFYQYDALGNLTLKVDPRGAMVTNTYNVLCQLIQQKHLDTNGVTVLSTEGYGYEPGGLVRYYTNALGGVTAKFYTATGKPEFQSNPDGSTNAWRYYLDGRIKREIQRNGAYWETTYDDVNRTTTRIFYSASGTPQATNSTQLDYRGNVAQKVDAGGNIFTTTYDGLDRAKVIAGPAIVTVDSHITMPGGDPTYVTNVLQQTSTNFYDAAGRALTNRNVLGETTVTTADAIGRPTSTKIYSASGSLVRETYTGYTPDHYGTTITNGSGSTAIVTTSYTDNDGHSVLNLKYASSSITNFTWSDYDLAGNLVDQENDSFPYDTNSWHGMFYIYDGLNRPTYVYDRDNAITTNTYNALGNLTIRAMPGGLTWQASYNNAGQILQEKYTGTGGVATRTNNYAYYSSGSAFAGLLQTKSDGRGVSCAYSYDDWLRPTNMAYSGSSPEQNLTTTWAYESRGLVTGIIEQFASTNTGPATSVQRSYDAYGQLSSETVSAGTFAYSDSQSWNAAGRRTQLGLGGGYGFSWQADGNLISVSGPTGNGSYSYDTAGLLTSRTIGNRVTTITSRDGQGRPLTIDTTVNLLSQLTESFTWSGDGLLSAHTLARTDFTDYRAYSYGYLSRRLTQEQLNLNGSARWTNTLVYDNGAAAGIGSLSQVQQQASGSSNTWTGVADAFSRASTETNGVLPYTAYGHVNGQATLSAWLDGTLASITATGTNAMQWRSAVELTPGAHQLKVAAAHPSGFYTAWATNSFTNNIAYQTTADTFDSAGNVTQRVWKNPNGTTNRIQTLSWDARGRLYAITERDAGNSGYDWSAVYDGLNRRLSTAAVVVSNGVAFTTQPTTINSYYDPQVEFLELGVAYKATSEWKLYGPDLSGKYGGLNGVGGLEAVSPYLNTFSPLVCDFRGNVLAVITNGVVSWNPARPTGYGAVPGYRPVPLGNGANISLASAWRGRWADISGYYQIGIRPYDPVSGSWLTYDPAWNDRDPNCYSFCGGDPINYFDSDGRLGRGLYASSSDFLGSTFSLAKNAYFSMSYGLTDLFYGSEAADQSYGQNLQGLKNTIFGTAQAAYNVSALATYGLISPFAPDLAYNSYGGNVQQLANMFPVFYGGDNQSLAYQIGYGTFTTATFLIGGESSELGNLGRTSDFSGVVGGDSIFAGSIRNVNPTDGTMNCVNCSIASDATLAGNYASALPGGATSISALENLFGGSFQPVSGQMQIGSILSQSGNGSRGIIFGESLGGDIGHVFNVINNNGSIQFLDGQIGGNGLINFDSLQNFQFLLTHPGTP